MQFIHKHLHPKVRKEVIDSMVQLRYQGRPKESEEMFYLHFLCPTTQSSTR